MMGTRLLKIGALIIILITTLACGCNLSYLNPEYFEASFRRGNFPLDIFNGKTGNIRNDSAGIAYSVPEGFEAKVTSNGDALIDPKGAYAFTDPFITIMIQKYDGANDFNYWLNNQYGILVYSQKADILSESDVTISGKKGKRYDYSAQFDNPDDKNNKLEMTCYKIIIDLVPDRVMLLDAFWTPDRDTEIRPLFEKWLTTLELYTPIEQK